MGEERGANKNKKKRDEAEDYFEKKGKYNCLMFMMAFPNITLANILINEFKVDVNGTFILVDHSIFRAFNKGRLAKQEPANPIDYDALSDFWEQKAKSKN